MKTTFCELFGAGVSEENLKWLASGDDCYLTMILVGAFLLQPHCQLQHPPTLNPLAVHTFETDNFVNMNDNDGEQNMSVDTVVKRDPLEDAAAVDQPPAGQAAEQPPAEPAVEQPPAGPAVKVNPAEHEGLEQQPPIPAVKLVRNVSVVSI